MNRTIGKRASPRHIAGAHRAQASVNPHLGISGMQVVLHTPIKDSLLVLLLYFMRRVAPQQSAFRAIGGVSFGLISDVAVRIPGVKGSIVLFKCRFDVLCVIRPHIRSSEKCLPQQVFLRSFLLSLLSSCSPGLWAWDCFDVHRWGGVKDDSKRMDRPDVPSLAFAFGPIQA